MDQRLVAKARYPAPIVTESFGGFFNVCRMTQ
jgi:hypothetical protein